MRNIFRTVLGTVVLSSGAVLAAQTFTSFDFPGATSTNAQGINAKGEIVGGYTDSAGKPHGYVLNGGTFTPINYPGAIATLARGINDAGDIVGHHIDQAGLPGGGFHGFQLRQGSFTDVNYPLHMNTIAVKINNAGQIVGCYHDTDTMGTMHGFLFKSGAFSAVMMATTMNNGVNADGTVTAGLYTDMMTGMGRAYIASNDAFAPFDFPFSISTSVWDMSESGEVVGGYVDSAKKVHGFLLTLGDSDSTSEEGTKPVKTGPFHFVSLDYPGARATQAFGVNRRGDVVGAYQDSAGKTHAFVFSRERHGED